MRRITETCDSVQHVSKVLKLDIEIKIKGTDVHYWYTKRIVTFCSNNLYVHFTTSDGKQ